MNRHRLIVLFSASLASVLAIPSIVTLLFIESQVLEPPSHKSQVRSSDLLGVVIAKVHKNHCRCDTRQYSGALWLSHVSSAETQEWVA